MAFLSAVSAQQHLLPPVIFLVMLAVGMELKPSQFRDLVAQPRVPLVGTLVHSLTFPALAVTALLTANLAEIDVTEATVLGVLLIAASPSGGFSNVLAMMARANLPLSIVLTAVSSLLSFVSVPLLISGFGLLVLELQGDVSIPVGQTLVQLGLLVLLPVIAGMWMSHFIGWLTQERVVKIQSRSQLLLYITVALMIGENWNIMKTGIVEALPWSMGLCITNILACFWLSKFARIGTEDAVTIALEGSIRNLGIAFLIAANTLNRPDIAVFPTVYFLSVLVIAILFAKTWRRLPGFSA